MKSTRNRNTDQRQALASLLQGAEGFDWSNSHHGWDDITEVCDWEGISCGITFDSDETNNLAVTSINLPNTGLSGTLSPQLGLLTHLESINLRGNLIRGSIPEKLTQLTQLLEVDLSDCQLEGILPQHWSSGKLSKLLLGQNNLSGRFFQDVSSPHLTSVQEVDVAQNKLDGTLNGSAIARMSNLESLSLSQNKLYGLLPGREFGSLSGLKYLYLDSNHFTGPILSSLANAPLEELWLQDNAFSGTVPASFARLNKLHDFFIDGNKLTGQLPDEMCRTEVNSDFVEATTATAVMGKCDTIACPSGSISLEGMYPCSTCDTRKHPYLGQRAEACRTWSQSDILKMFYRSTTKYGAWKRGNEVWMDDSIDVCEFAGITCDGGNVVKIELSNMGLSGTIPGELGFLPFLQELNIADNDLTGFLPSDLRWVDLSNLDVSGNRIRGIVPPLLCNMEGISGSCDKIACPSGTYSARGKHYATEKEAPCLPCFDGNPYIGQKSCTQKIEPHSIIGEIEIGSEVVIQSVKNLELEHTTKLGLVIAFVLLGMVPLICFLRRGRQWKQIQIYRKTKPYRTKNRDIVYHEQGEAPLEISVSDGAGSFGLGISEDTDKDEALWWAIQRYGEDHAVVRSLRMCEVHHGERMTTKTAKHGNPKC